MTKDSTPMFDPTALSRELEIDEVDVLQMLYGEYLDQLDEMKFTFMRAGALSSSRSEIAQLAHRIKSSSQAVGALQLSNCLRQLEQAAAHNAPELHALFSTVLMLIEPTQRAIRKEIMRLGTPQSV